MSVWSGMALGAFSGHMAANAAGRISSIGNNSGNGISLDELVDMYNELVERFDSKNDSLRIAISQMGNLMVYINGLRIMAGEAPLEPDDIADLIGNNETLSQLHALVTEATEKSDYGRFSQQQSFWREMSNNAFIPFNNHYQSSTKGNINTAKSTTPEAEILELKNQKAELEQKLASYQALFGEI